MIECLFLSLPLASHVFVKSNHLFLAIHTKQNHETRQIKHSACSIGLLNNCVLIGILHGRPGRHKLIHFVVACLCHYYCILCMPVTTDSSSCMYQCQLLMRPGIPPIAGVKTHHRETKARRPQENGQEAQDMWTDPNGLHTGFMAALIIQLYI